MENEFLQVSGRARAAAAQDFPGGSASSADHVDPLDAFRDENELTLDAAAGGEAEAEVDTLHAFMAEIAPAVRRDLAAATTATTADAQAAQVLGKLRMGLTSSQTQTTQTSCMSTSLAYPHHCHITLNNDPV